MGILTVQYTDESIECMKPGLVWKTASLEFVIQTDIRTQGRLGIDLERVSGNCVGNQYVHKMMLNSSGKTR